MALFVLGDPHLSLGASKPMDIFPGWNDYVDRLEKNWRKLITPQDTIVLAGDISWAMRLTDTRKDFAFLQQLPGQKIIMKGNHDYWWSTANKMAGYGRVSSQAFGEVSRRSEGEICRLSLHSLPLALSPLGPHLVIVTTAVLALRIMPSLRPIKNSTEIQTNS